MNKQLVFVYGDSRKCGANAPILEGATFIKEVKTARFYELRDAGPYPVLLPSTNAKVPVQGELYEVDEDTLAKLDRLEGFPHLGFYRLPILLENGEYGPEAVEAYLYGGDATRFPKIESGNWIDRG